jgi:hypothetical protein
MRFGGKSKKGLAVVTNEPQDNVQLTTAGSTISSKGSDSPSSTGSTTSKATTKATSTTEKKAKPRITTTTQTFRANGTEVHHLAEISDVEDEAAAGGAADMSADDLSSTKCHSSGAAVSVHPPAEVSDMECETGANEDTDADIQSSSSSDESSIYSTEDEDDDDDGEDKTAKADNCDKYANAESSDEENDDGESKAESLEVTSEEYRSSLGEVEDGTSAMPEEPTEDVSTTEKDDSKNKKDKGKDDLSLTAKPDKLNTSDHLNADSTESTVATQDDEVSSQASEDTSECEDTTLETTPWVKIKSETETVAPVEVNTVIAVETKTVAEVEKEQELETAKKEKELETAKAAVETAKSAALAAAADASARKQLLQQYRDEATSKSIPQLIRQDLMNNSAHTIQIRAALDELAARASPVKHDLNDEYADHKTRVEQANKHRASIARTGGLLAIVQSMERFTDNADIQVSACRALEKLALDGENETAIADVGGVEAILAAMMANFMNEAVHEAAWGALMNLSCRNADSVMTVDTAGGMEAIIAAMQQHVDNPAIQRHACGTLANLCISNDTRRAALAKAGGFVAISAALQRHWNDSDVKDEASSALTALLEEPARHYDAHLERA